MYLELSNEDKKAARIIIDQGIRKEYENMLAGAGLIIDNWRNSTVASREAYQDLYDHVNTCDKQIAFRYNGLGGSRYFFAVATQYKDGLVTDEDLATLSEEVRQKIDLLLSL